MGIREEIAGKVAAGKASQGGNWIKPGGYTFEVQMLLIERKFAGDMFIAEFKVLDSRKTDAGIEPNLPGTTASYVVNMQQLSGPGNVKSFLMALFDEPEEEVTIDAILAATDKNQPARFLKIRDEAYNKPVRSKPGQLFTAHRWEHMAPSDMELKSIAERRKAEK